MDLWGWNSSTAQFSSVASAVLRPAKDDTSYSISVNSNNKEKWLLGQFIYIILVTALYTVLMLLFTSVLCMKDSYPGNLWSETAAMLGYSELGEKLAGPLYSKSHGEYLSVWLYAAGFSPVILLFPDTWFCNPCWKSL